MSVENEAPQAANDAAVSNDQNTQAAENSQVEAGENTEAEGDGSEGEEQASEPELVEVTLDDGRKVKVPKDVEGHLLRQADYTRKTQEVAEERRRLEAERESFRGDTVAQQSHFAAATKLAAIDEQLGAYANVDWQTLYNTNPDAYQQHRINYDQLKDKRDSAARDFSQKEQERRQSSERENATRIEKAVAEIKRLVPEWTPGGELDVKLEGYGTKLGFSKQEMADMTLRNPNFLHQLNRLRAFDEAATKQKTQQQFQASQAAQPVTRVGGNGGSAARKTTDASGDGLSTAEWVKRERERLDKAAPARR